MQQFRLYPRLRLRNHLRVDLLRSRHRQKRDLLGTQRRECAEVLQRYCRLALLVQVFLPRPLLGQQFQYRHLRRRLRLLAFLRQDRVALVQRLRL